MPPQTERLSRRRVVDSCVVQLSKLTLDVRYHPFLYSCCLFSTRVPILHCLREDNLYRRSSIALEYSMSIALLAAEFLERRLDGKFKGDLRNLWEETVRYFCSQIPELAKRSSGRRMA